jgi:hypothetical protein
VHVRGCESHALAHVYRAAAHPNTLLLHAHTNTRREFIRQFGPAGHDDGAAPLSQLLAQHAPTLVAGLLAALAASQDLGLAAAVREAALAMCACAPDYAPEAFAERWVARVRCQHARHIAHSETACAHSHSTMRCLPLRACLSSARCTSCWSCPGHQR